MAENKTGLNFILMLVTALVVVGLIQALSSLFGSDSEPGQVADAAVLERIKPVGQLNTGEPIVVAGPAAPEAAAPAASAAAPSSAAVPATAAAAAPAPAAKTPTKAAARSGEQVYKSACMACHGTGAAGAPKLGDKAAWGPRVKQGMDVLVSHAVKGFTGKSGMMPPRGTCGTCSDDELRGAVEYMVSKSK